MMNIHILNVKRRSTPEQKAFCGQLAVRFIAGPAVIPCIKMSDGAEQQLFPVEDIDSGKPGGSYRIRGMPKKNTGGTAA
jgi:hypothetical protein